MGVCVCHPCIGEAETGKSLGPTDHLPSESMIVQESLVSHSFKPILEAGPAIHSEFQDSTVRVYQQKEGYVGKLESGKPQKSHHAAGLLQEIY